MDESRKEFRGECAVDHVPAKYEPKKFPSKLYARASRYPMKESAGGMETFTELDGNDGDMIAVYRLSFVRRLNVRKNLALRAGDK